jgi:hypothetical protein
MVMGAVAFATPAQAANPVNYVSHGGGASYEGYFCEGLSTGGSSCGYQYVSVAERATLSDGSTVSNYVTLFRDEYTYDADGNYVSQSHTDGKASGSGVQFSQAGSLSSTRVSTTVPAWTCEPFGCYASSIPINLTWTGTGPTYRSHGVSTIHGDGYQAVSQANSVFRNATVSGYVGSTTVNDAFGYQYRGSSISLSTTR